MLLILPPFPTLVRQSLYLQGPLSRANLCSTGLKEIANHYPDRSSKVLPQEQIRTAPGFLFLVFVLSPVAISDDALSPI